MILPENSVTIGKLRATGQPGKAMALRPAVERLLAGADLQPPGAPPAAVLIVRRLVDPQPGRMAAGLGAARVRAEWERAVRDRLGALYRTAARPALGSVPASAEAVVFADEAELLACLALDVARGLAGGRWWWRAAPAGRAAAAGGLAAVLAEHGALLPALLAELRRRGAAAEVVAALPPAGAAAVLRAALRALDLPDLAATAGAPAGALPADGAPPLPPAAPPPWGWAGPPELGRERLALLGIGADAHERPYVVRRAAYWTAARRWWSAAAAPPPHRPPPEAEAARSPAAAAPTAPPPAIAGDTQRPGAATPAPETAAATPAGPPAPAAARPQARPQAATPHAPAATPAARLQAATPHAPAAAAAPAAPALPAPALPAPAATRLGGVFYLVNLMAALGLPDGFDAGWRLDDVGAWGLLEGLARGLLGRLPPDLAADPLWAALAQLDGRAPGQLPGARLPRSRPRRWPPFRLPPAWRAGLPPEPGRAAWHAGRGRLRLLAPAGYPLADLPRAAGAPAAQAAAELSRYGLAGAAAGAPAALSPVADLPPLLARWLALALPFIRHRLRLALRAPDGEPEAPVDFLHLPAALHLSRTHVDLLIPLERVALAARRAGLDRDPGWLPRFGRVIYFHFE